MGLTETPLNVTNTDSLVKELTPPNFKLWQVAQNHYSGGGVGLLVRSSLTVELLQVGWRLTFQIIDKMLL